MAVKWLIEKMSRAYLLGKWVSVEMLQNMAKPFRWLLLAVTCAFLCLIISTALRYVSGGEDVSFEDPVLEKAVRAEAGVLFGPLLESDLKRIRDINIVDSDLRSLEGIQSCENLVSLTVSGSFLSDLRPLSSLEFLEVCAIEHSNISDVAPLGQIESLEKLWLRGNHITDISSLSGCSHLRVLMLDHNEISVIGGGVWSLPELETLSLASNAIVDSTFFEEETQVVTLNCSYNAISQLSSFENAEKLYALDLSGNPIRSIDGLGFTPSLQRLDVSSTLIEDIGFLSEIETLVSLDITSTNVADLVPLIDLPCFEYLRAYDIGPLDLSVLSELDSFCEIYIGPGVDRSQLGFMEAGFKDADPVTKQYLLKLRHGLN